VKLLQPNAEYTFRSYFELPQDTDEVLAEFDYKVAPILSLVTITCQQILRIEYPLKVNNLLEGNLDYLLRGANSLIVIEAKQDDMTRGFTQLAVEMIALSLVNDSSSMIYGAVTMGTLWTFGFLEESSKTIFQDILSYRVPSDLEELVSILVGILE
jgi:hypothetical protein